MDPGPAPLLLPGEGSEWGPLFPVPGRVHRTVAEGHNWASMSTRHMGHLKIKISDLVYLDGLNWTLCLSYDLLTHSLTTI